MGNLQRFQAPAGFRRGPRESNRGKGKRRRGLKRAQGWDGENGNINGGNCSWASRATVAPV